jgi:hypothetical protein
MTLYKFNVFANYRTQVGEMWAKSKFDVQLQIERDFPACADIYVWMA